MGTNIIRIVLDSIEWLWRAILICVPPMALIFSHWFISAVSHI